MAMDTTQLEAAVSLLLTEMDGEIEDQHAVYLRLEHILGQMRATGMPLPEDLVRMEDEMAAGFAADAAASEAAQP
jgi:hypothetical protein